MLISPQEAPPTPDRRWPLWMPWAVVGAGAVVTGAGGLLYNSASREYASYDKAFDATCPDGCTDDDNRSLSDRRSRAQTLETSSRISMVVGGATIATGALLLLLNRTIDPESDRFIAAPGALSLQQEADGVAGRRWPVWMPWSVVGAGAVVVGVGGVLYGTASREYDSFDEQFDEICTTGCTDSEAMHLSEQLGRAQTLENSSRISLVVGGATVATGAVLLFLNHLGAPPSERAAARTFVVPTLSPGAAGIAAGFSF